MKNIYTNCKSAFRTNDRWEEFESAIRLVVSAKTPEVYHDTIQELKDNFNFNEGIPFSMPITASSEEMGAALSREVERKAVTYVLGQWLGPH